MKIVPLRRKPVDAVDLIRQVLETPGQGTPLTIDMIRRRGRVLDKLDAAVEKLGDADGELHLEDQDHLTLKGALESFPWGTSKREVLRIIDDILEAKDPPPAEPKVP